jgi:Histidine phosphatase superfamily (branch 1)
VRRPGAIVLARHGEPALARDVKLTAQQYRDFWAQYEVLGILPGQTPPETLTRLVATAGTLVSSTRLRSVESATIVAAGRRFVQHEVLIEAPLPPPPWPSWIRLSPKIWGFVARVWWWYFNHHEGQETRLAAEARAERACDLLIGHAEDGEDVVVLAHGFFNFMIGRALKKRGWKQVSTEGYKYWSTRRFERL